MLCQIFPRHIIEYLSDVANSHHHMRISEVSRLAREHQDVTVLFMDVVGFTTMSKEVAPEQVLSFLNRLFSIFDMLVGMHGVQKVETAGDCYIVACGVLSRDREGFQQVAEDHSAQQSARRVMEFAKDMLRCSKQVLMPNNGEPVVIRIGMHTGRCVSGIIGTKMPKFSMFGDTINTASRMESTSTPGRIQVSATTWALLRDYEEWQATGGIEVKGKGRMDTFMWQQPPTFLSSPPAVALVNDQLVVREDSWPREDLPAVVPHSDQLPQPAWNKRGSRHRGCTASCTAFCTALTRQLHSTASGLGGADGTGSSCGPCLDPGLGARSGLHPAAGHDRPHASRVPLLFGLGSMTSSEVSEALLKQLSCIQENGAESVLSTCNM